MKTACLFTVTFLLAAWLSGEEGPGKWHLGGNESKKQTWVYVIADRALDTDGKVLTNLKGSGGRPWVCELAVGCMEGTKITVFVTTHVEAEPFPLQNGFSPIFLTYDGDGPFGMVAERNSDNTKPLYLLTLRDDYFAQMSGANFRLSEIEPDGHLMATDEGVLERLLRSRKLVVKWAPKGAKPGELASYEFDTQGLSEAIRPVLAACPRAPIRPNIADFSIGSDQTAAFRKFVGMYPAEKDVADPAAAKSVYAAVSKAVVTLIVRDRSGRQTASGSGVVVSEDGRILTNYHVVEGGTSFEARFPAGEGDSNPIPARPTGCSEESDLATLTVTSSKPLSVARLDYSVPSVGDRVFAIGSPLELEGTLSEGVVSQLRELGGIPLIQTTAQISPGSSGGGLFLGSGSLIGITEMTLKGGQNLNFAVHVSAMARLQPCSSFKASNPPLDAKRKRSN